jgi:hypothetical protein
MKYKWLKYRWEKDMSIIKTSMFKYAFGNMFKMNGKERIQFFVAVVFSGFILSMLQFVKWGSNKIDASTWLQSFLLYTILFIIIYFLFVSAQKFLGLYLGYNCTFETWYYGPVIGLMITFMIYGIFPILYLGNIRLKEDMKFRLGKFRNYLNIKDMMFVGMAGPAAIFVLVLILQPIYLLTHAQFIKDSIWICSLILLFSALPLPKTNGINIILKSRFLWVAYFILSIVLFLLLQKVTILTYLAGVVIALTIGFLIQRVVKSGLF